MILEEFWFLLVDLSLFSLTFMIDLSIPSLLPVEIDISAFIME